MAVPNYNNHHLSASTEGKVNHLGLTFSLFSSLFANSNSWFIFFSHSLITKSNSLFSLIIFSACWAWSFRNCKKKQSNGAWKKNKTWQLLGLLSCKLQISLPFFITNQTRALQKCIKWNIIKCPLPLNPTKMNQHFCTSFMLFWSRSYCYQNKVNPANQIPRYAIQSNSTTY